MRSGSGYRFTREHVREIFQLLEERPELVAAPKPAAASARQRGDRHPGGPVVQLRAKRPRRARNAA
ncbi:hypothetical protein [Streptomyces sp. NPDC055287]